MHWGADSIYKLSVAHSRRLSDLALPRAAVGLSVEP